MNEVLQSALDEFASHGLVVAEILAKRPYCVTVSGDGKVIEQVRIMAANPCDAVVSALNLLFADIDTVKPRGLKIIAAPIERTL